MKCPFHIPNIGGDEQGDTGAKSVALLQQLVQTDNNDSGKEQLDDDEDGIASSQITDITIHAREHIRNGLTNSDQHSQQLLSTVPA